MRLIVNMIMAILFVMLAILATIGAMCCGAWWHLMTAAMAVIIAAVLYTDKAAGGISVKDIVSSMFGR